MARMRSLENKRWLVEFYHQWDSFIPNVRWRDFTFINIEGEWNPSWPLVEFRVCLLGLGVRVVRQLDSGPDCCKDFPLCNCGEESAPLSVLPHDPKEKA